MIKTPRSLIEVIEETAIEVEVLAIRREQVLGIMEVIIIERIAIQEKIVIK
jgi:hypothetical protein